jgi:hypothetical protein
MLYFYLSVPILAVFHMHALAMLGVAWVPFLSIFGKVFLMSFQLIALYGVMASLD